MVKPSIADSDHAVDRVREWHASNYFKRDIPAAADCGARKVPTGPEDGVGGGLTLVTKLDAHWRGKIRELSGSLARARKSEELRLYTGQKIAVGDWNRRSTDHGGGDAFGVASLHGLAAVLQYGRAEESGGESALPTGWGGFVRSQYCADDASDADPFGNVTCLSHVECPFRLRR